MGFLEQFIVGRQLGKGSFGEVFHGIDLNTIKDVAIKKEDKHDNSRVFHEAKLYKVCKSNFVPRVKWVGSHESHNILVMDKLGKSLEEIFKTLNYTFSIKCVLLIAIQLLERIQFIHSKNIIHRDIKPQNCLIGVNSKKNKIYLIDFGLAKYYIDPKTGQHIAEETNRGLVGTARYTSLNIHNGITPSRRDDLQSIGYMLIYFLNGKLPWQGVKLKDKKARYNRIRHKKRAIGIEELCKNIPNAFKLYLEYIAALTFQQDPDYNYLIELFKTLYTELEYKQDDMFDWC